MHTTLAGNFMLHKTNKHTLNKAYNQAQDILHLNSKRKITLHANTRHMHLHKAHIDTCMPKPHAKHKCLCLCWTLR